MKKSTFEQEADAVFDAIDWSEYVGAPLSSQQRNIPDIHYLWGPGRLLAQQMQWFSAFLFFFSAIAFMAGAKELLSGSNDTISRAVSNDTGPVFTPLSPVRHATPDRCQSGVPTYDILDVGGGKPFKPGNPSIDWRQATPSTTADLRDKILGFRQARRSDTQANPWQEEKLEERTVGEFFTKPFLFNDQVSGAIAQGSLGSGVQYTFIGTYVSDARAADMVNRCAAATSGDGTERSVAPIVFIERVDPSSRDERNRVITYVLQDHRLATINGSSLIQISLLHIAEEFRQLVPQVEIEMDGTETRGRAWASVKPRQ